MALISPGLAQAQGVGGQDPGPAAAVAPSNVYLGIKEYRWTFRVPVIKIEHRNIVTQVFAPVVRTRRLEYEVPGVRSERRKIARVAEFSCKYPDLTLPNQCRTRWRDVYADVPIAVMRHEHVEFEVTQWAWQERRIVIDLPRWSWTEQSLVVSVPAIVHQDARRPGRSLATETTIAEAAPAAKDERGATVASPSRAEIARESMVSAQTTLEARQAAAMKAIDDGIGSLAASIESVKAQGADPTKLASSDSTTIDLYATRDVLLQEKARELARFEQVRAELNALASRNATIHPPD